MVAVGPGKLKDDGTNTPMSVRVGDTVLSGRYAGNDYPGDVTLVILREDDILAVIEE